MPSNACAFNFKVTLVGSEPPYLCGGVDSLDQPLTEHITGSRQGNVSLRLTSPHEELADPGEDAEQEGSGGQGQDRGGIAVRVRVALGGRLAAGDGGCAWQETYCRIGDIGKGPISLPWV